MAVKSTDLTRETAQIRNSKLPGSNFVAQGFGKIQLGFREIEQSLGVTIITETFTNYTAQYTDDVIINTASHAITVTFPVQQGRQKFWFVLTASALAPVNFRASLGTVLGAQGIVMAQTGFVATDGNNLICGNGTIIPPP